MNHRWKTLGRFLALAVMLGACGAAAFAQAVATSLGAGADRGFEISGTARILSSAHRRDARFYLLTLGAHQWEIILQIPGQGVYRAVVNGTAAQVRKPRGLFDIPMPGGPEEFCDLLPQASLLADLASGQAQSTAVGAVDGLTVPAERVHVARTNVTRSGESGMDLDLDAATGLPLRIVHTTRRGQTVTVTYSHYQRSGDIEYPTHIEKSVDGQLRLVLDVTRFASRSGLSAADFFIPAPGRR